MASWITHLRFAQMIKQHLPLDETLLYWGCVAPDSGRILSDGLTYQPASKISHCQKDKGKCSIDHEGFYQAYVLGANKQELAYYVGYLTHLFCDKYWVEKIVLPAKQAYQKALALDPSFIFKIKAEWYQLDHLFLSKQQVFDPLAKLESAPDLPYLPWFRSQAIKDKVKQIIAFYQDAKMIDGGHIYTDEKMVASFLAEQTQAFLEGYGDRIRNLLD
ncbi:MAG: zinc dependent phospholipase C family protein [Erysipelotrichaceae bacterium]|nr:zinc dependent phospholipase C family protein [Erysipelotrichaceae bacterium]MDY5251548.1 zinc dependent phospholipase C family protein [Erysipelotrichaceae bacterium]